MKARKVLALLFSFTVIFTLSTGCGLNNGKAALTNSTNVKSTAQTLVKGNPTDNAGLLKTDIDTSSFKPIKSAATSKFYESVNRPYDTRIVKGSFDFDGDGLIDNFEVVFTSDEDLNTFSSVKIGDSTETLNLYGLAGVYAVKLYNNSTENILAVVEYSTDNYIVTHFFRFSMGRLINLGSVGGGFARDTTRQFFENEYNETILVDGCGNLIPRYGLIKFLEPAIVISILKLDGNRLSRVYYNPNDTLQKQYTVKEDINPYFENGITDFENASPRCDDNDKITIPAGTKITIKGVSTSLDNLECSLVTLPDDKQGIIYFFLHP